MCTIPFPTYTSLKGFNTTKDKHGQERIKTALIRGLNSPIPTRSSTTPPLYKSVCITIDEQTSAQTQSFADVEFGGDVNKAAGWLIAYGLGITTHLPTYTPTPPPRPPVITTTPLEIPQTHYQVARRIVARPHRAQRIPPPDGEIITGEQIREQREALGISQRDLAQSAGLLRGSITEAERGRRRGIDTRLRIAEALARLRAEKATKNPNN